MTAEQSPIDADSIELLKTPEMLATATGGYPNAIVGADRQSVVLEVLSKQLDDNPQPQVVQGTLIQVMGEQRYKVAGQFSDIGAYIADDGRLHLVTGDAAFEETEDHGMDGVQAYGAVQMLKWIDPKLAKDFEERVANVISG